MNNRNQFAGYDRLTDRELVERIIAVPHDEHAAVYLLYERYSPLFRKLCLNIFGHLCWYEDCLGELYVYLKGEDGHWFKLSSFEWRCRFAHWISITARNRFMEIRPYLIGKINNPLSIDDPDSPTVPIADGGAEEYERNQERVLLLEAVSLLPDDDQRFVILKTLQGFSSKETARLLQEKWQHQGVCKRDKKGSLVVPSAGYVDVCRQRARAELKIIIEKIIS
ncbi:MAG: RNA polymerase sigma factor [Prevotella sp.]